MGLQGTAAVEQLKQEVLARFISYVKVDTQSNEESDTCPTTAGQLKLGKQLVDELKAIGLQDITQDSNGYVMATLPANTTGKSGEAVPTIGFLAHLDTATELSGANVNPKVVEYAGGDIALNAEVVLSPREFPELANYKGHTLVTTDGTTLLGADDKAGIAEIMTAIAYLKQHPEIKHGAVRVGFLPDEEIGRGPHRFDVAAFGASFAYTVDGGPLGELQYESFHAAAAKITIKGVNVHPGTAKGKMINAASLAAELARQLPAAEVPEQTEGYEGFFHLQSISGTVEAAELRYIIRDFDRANFEERKQRVQQLVSELQQRIGAERVSLELKDQYHNMREKIEPVFEIVETARQAMESLTITPIIEPIRGGTDGSQLSYMGLPTPNLFTGGENYHGRFEYVSVDNMVKSVQVIVRIAELFAQHQE